MFDVTFWRATLERAVRTAAQALVAVLGADTVNWLEVDWAGTLATAGGAALLAVLTAIAASGGGRSGPGLTEVTRPITSRPTHASGPAGSGGGASAGSEHS